MARNLPIYVNDSTTPLNASDFNAINSEIENLVESTDQTLDVQGGPDTDLYMVSKAAAAYAVAGQHYRETGSADAYVLSRSTNLLTLPAYTDGMSVTFKAGNTNTGASTVNVAGLGLKNITTPDGSALPAGLIQEDSYISVIYNSGSDRFELSNTSSSEFQPGTTMVFCDTSSAPVGWTRKTDWQDGAMFTYKATGTPGNGGSADPKATHTHSGPSHAHNMSHSHNMSNHTHPGTSHIHSTSGHTLTTTEIPPHTHPYRDRYYIESGPNGVYYEAVPVGYNNGFGSGDSDYNNTWFSYIDEYTNSTGGGGSHSHGNTGSAGSGATGTPSNNNTSTYSSSTGNAGTGATGANTAPYYQEVIVAVKS